MGQKSNKTRSAKQSERLAKSERNMNRAVILLTGGLVAEWYLLLVDRYYARGSVEQLVRWFDAFGVIRWVGLAAFLLGIALCVLRKENPLFQKMGMALAGVGGFFSFTSFAMRHYYPTSVTVLCVLVPVLLILGIVYLFYQVEFSVQATALAMALGALVLLGRSGTAVVRLCGVLSLCGTAALLAGTLLLKKNGGVFRRGDTSVRVFPANTDYRITLGVLALCFAVVALALCVSSAAFYATWVMTLAAFVLAVYYTIKLM